jgi:adenosylcobinamide-phosphate synthase
MNALILAVAALLFSRLVASDRIEPYRLQVISAIEKATDALPNTLRLPVIVGGSVTIGAIIAYMPLIGAVVTFCALVLIIEYGRVTEDSKAILTELRSGSFSQAQIKLTEFSGTDASQLDENGVARITVESQVLKLAQKVFIPLAWFALGGLPGILLYWTSTVIAQRHGSGETSERWVSLLNWVPIRLMALTLGFMGDRERSRAIWNRQANDFSDPEAGVLVAATAGALRVKLGGSRCVQGLIKQEPLVGDGDDAARYHIEETQSLAERSLLLWAVAALVITAI